MTSHTRYTVSFTCGALLALESIRIANVYVQCSSWEETEEKLSVRMSALASQESSAPASASQKTQATRELTKIRSLLKEIEEYERDLLLPLATEKIAIDLDDSVRVNYPRFGAALKKIAGLKAKEVD